MSETKKGIGNMSSRRIEVFFYGLFMDAALLRTKGAHPINIRTAGRKGGSRNTAAQQHSSTAGRAQAQWPATRIPARETYARNRDARLLQYLCGQNPARKSRHRSSAITGGKIVTAKQARVYLSRLLKMNEAALLIRRGRGSSPEAGADTVAGPDTRFTPGNTG